MMMRDIIDLGYHEVMSINTVANMTLAIGFQGDKCAYVIRLEWASERVEVPTKVGHAILRLFIEGDEGNAALYELIKDEHLPKDPALRPIP
jgi:hypothetical protein